MQRLWHIFDRVDPVVVEWMARHGITLLRVSLGLIFLWFGALKLFPGLSPAQELAGRTIEQLSFGLVGPKLSLPVLAVWECLIGLGLLSGKLLRLTLALLFLQMPGTLLPLVFYPTETWTVPGLVPTLEGQYIIKNLVLISAGIVVGATVRGGRIVVTDEHAEPATARGGASSTARL